MFRELILFLYVQTYKKSEYTIKQNGFLELYHILFSHEDQY